MSPVLDFDATTARPAWQMERRSFTLGGERRSLRLVCFETGWLASVDTESGPTLGVDRSPYLAAARALDPLGIDQVDAMTLVGTVPRSRMER